jgi:molecular chaperone GrpE
MQLYKQLLEVLSKSFGAKEIEAVGKEFDFNLHAAIVRGESTEFDENHVIEVLQRGFTIGDKLVRPAGVRVSMGPGPGGAASESEAAAEAE